MHPLSRRWINSDHISLHATTNNNNVEDATGRRERSKRCRMVLGALFLVLALVIGTKRLAFVITVFAFLLLVLESFGFSSKFVFMLNSCFLLLHKSVVQFEYDRTNEYSDVSDKSLLFDSVSDDYSSGYTTSSGEIEIVDQVTIRSVMNETKTKSGSEDVILEDEGLGNKKRRSKRAVLKSKIIHKLVPKKLRHSKKYKGSEGRVEDVSTNMKVNEGNGSSSVGNLTIRQVMCESESESEELPIRSLKVDDGKQSGELSWSSHCSLEDEADGVIFGQGHGVELLRKFDITKKPATSRIQGDARGKSGYVMLVVIVLAGLIGGRILSFFLAVGYCFILKYTCTIRRDDTIKPIFTSSEQK